MRQINNIEKAMQGISSFELADGRRLDLQTQDVEFYGLEACARTHGVDISARVNVYQDGVLVGTLPGSFHPSTAASQSLYYRPRASDFTPFHDGWSVASSLGPGDLQAIPGFEAT